MTDAEVKLIAEARQLVDEPWRQYLFEPHVHQVLTALVDLVSRQSHDAAEKIKFQSQQAASSRGVPAGTGGQVIKIPLRACCGDIKDEDGRVVLSVSSRLVQGYSEAEIHAAFRQRDDVAARVVTAVNAYPDLRAACEALIHTDDLQLAIDLARKALNEQGA